jgi:hypothetical protein
MNKDNCKFPGSPRETEFAVKLSPGCRDVPMHLPRSQEVLPFGITNKKSLNQSRLMNQGLLLDQSRSVDQEKNRDVPIHLPRSQEVLPFGITNKESLAEGPTHQEDLMRPTSSSTTSREMKMERARNSSR